MKKFNYGNADLVAPVRIMRRALRGVGLSASRLTSVPYGVDPIDDLSSLIPRASVFFDVGGNVGQTVDSIRVKFPDSRIYSFEPVPATFEMLRARHSGTAGVSVVSTAIGDHVGEIEISTGEDIGHNSIYKVSGPRAQSARVPLTTVDDFARSAGLSSIDVLKIDVEGAEVAVLQGAKGMLGSHKIEFVLAECDFGSDESELHGDFFEICHALREHGYRVVTFYTGGIDGRGWRWGDVLFRVPKDDFEVTCSPHQRKV